MSDYLGVRADQRFIPLIRTNGGRDSYAAIQHNLPVGEDLEVSSSRGIPDPGLQNLPGNYRVSKAGLDTPQPLMSQCINISDQGIRRHTEGA